MSEEQQPKKLELKDAIHHISVQLGEMETIKENIKSIIEQVKDERGKDVASRVNKLAKLLHEDKYVTLLSEIDELQELNDELFNTK